MKHLIYILIVISLNTYSHPGPRSKTDGCHYCKKDCERFNLTANTRHAHTNKPCDKRKGLVDSQKFIQTRVNTSKYNRKSFKHWIDTDKDCRNTRNEILIERSIVAVTYKKRKNGKECTVDTGKWKDYYYDEVLMKASDIDVDHIVPLKHAWEDGANLWDKKTREKFANDPENLVLTNKKYNRQKGAKTPLEWAPIDREYNCKYLKQWIYVKNKYKLSIKQKIYDYINLANCNL